MVNMDLTEDRRNRSALAQWSEHQIVALGIRVRLPGAGPPTEAGSLRNVITLALEPECEKTACTRSSAG